MVLVDDGQIIADGTHQQLLDTEPRYVETLAASLGETTRGDDGTAGGRRVAELVLLNRVLAPAPHRCRRPSEMQEALNGFLKRQNTPAPKSIRAIRYPCVTIEFRSLFERRDRLWGLFLLAVETVTALLRPVLTQQGIDNGVMQRDRGLSTPSPYSE